MSMRLLRCSDIDDPDEISFDFKEVTNNRRKSSDLPSYAILSHTWGHASQEVSLQDIQNGRGELKTGYAKILGFMKQTKRDFNDYGWIDTCCLDQTNKAEVSEAVNLMWTWYKKADICYVYLADVDKSSGDDWLSSRWWTRGWTLQELIAPQKVEFFDRNWNYITDKSSTIQKIYSRSGIPSKVLRDPEDIVSFSAAIRMSWSENRNTTKSEDKVYCLLGICNVSMLLNYGEGERIARRRLEEEMSKPGYEDHDVYGTIQLDGYGNLTSFETVDRGVVVSSPPQTASVPSPGPGHMPPYPFATASPSYGSGYMAPYPFATASPSYGSGYMAPYPYATPSIPYGYTAPYASTAQNSSMGFYQQPQPCRFCGVPYCNFHRGY